MRTLRFYFDYLSSNAYLAWTQLPKLASRFGVEVEPIPVLFAGLLEAHGQLGPAEVLPKAIWMAKNNLRKAALLGVPLNRRAITPSTRCSRCGSRSLAARRRRSAAR